MRHAGDIGGALAAAEQLIELVDKDEGREQALDLLAELRTRVADHRGAEVAYGEGLEIRRRLAATVATPEADRDLSVSLDNLGRVQGEGSHGLLAFASEACGRMSLAQGRISSLTRPWAGSCT